MINQTFINEALHIDHSMQVSKVASSIRQQSNSDGYISKYWMSNRHYLNESTLVKKLVKMQYHPSVANTLAIWLRKNVQNAYERGVFVVTDRVLIHQDIVADCEQALLAALRHKEPEYFDALKWYSKDDYINGLKRDKWELEICQTIGLLTLRYCRAAFTTGLKDACKALTK
jgi:hypothetical protein